MKASQGRFHLGHERPSHEITYFTKHMSAMISENAIMIRKHRPKGSLPRDDDPALPLQCSWNFDICLRRSPNAIHPHIELSFRYFRCSLISGSTSSAAAADTLNLRVILHLGLRYPTNTRRVEVGFLRLNAPQAAELREVSASCLQERKRKSSGSRKLTFS